MFFLLLSRLVRRRAIIAWVTFASFLAAFVFVLVSGNMYESRALLLPPVEEGGEGVLSAWMTKLNLPSIVAPSSAGSTSATILGDIIGSRRLREMIIDSLSLREHFKTESLDEALRALSARTSTSVTGTGLIHLSVRDKDPAYALRIADAYITGLDSLSRFLQYSRAEQTRKFMSAQLAIYRDRLGAARREIAAFQGKHNIVDFDEQVRGAIGVAAELKIKAVQAGIERDLIKEYSYANSLEFKRKNAEYEGLMRQLESIMNGDSAGAVFIPLDRMPALVQVHARMERDLEVNERVYAYLLERYEEANMDKARTTPVVQVVDEPNLPEKPSGRPKWLIVLFMTAVGFVWIVAAVLWWDWMREREKSSDEMRAFTELHATVRSDVGWLRRKLRF
jgi:capsular polysaccharide transport system permease protein